MNILTRNLAILSSGLALGAGGAYMGHEMPNPTVEQDKELSQRYELCAKALVGQTIGPLPEQCDDLGVHHTSVIAQHREGGFIYKAGHLLPSPQAVRHEFADDISAPERQIREDTRGGLIIGLGFWGCYFWVGHIMSKVAEAETRKRG